MRCDAWLTSFCCLLAAAGCVEERTLRATQPLRITDGERTQLGVAPTTPSGNPGAPTHPNSPAAVSRSFSLGSIPFDNFTLPLISPDGRLAATHTGRPPATSLFLARKDQRPPDDTAINIYSLSPSSRKPTSVGMVPAAAVLGRSVDDEGFLIESVQADGSRWLGKARWTERKVDWLVTDEHVNAFGILGPGPSLAWCRRSVDQTHFDLVLASSEGEWSTAIESDEPEPTRSMADLYLNAPKEEESKPSWFFPVFDGSPTDLIALRLFNGALDAVRLSASPESELLVETATIRLAENADDYVAFQVLSSYAPEPLSTTDNESGLSTFAEPLLFDPTMRCLCRWPRGSAFLEPIFPGTIAATPAANGQFVLTTGSDLMLTSAILPQAPRILQHTTAIPRRTTRSGREMISARPRDRGMIELFSLQWSDVASVAVSPPATE